MGEEIIKCGWPDLNQRHPRLQRGTLPTELQPHWVHCRNDKFHINLFGMQMFMNGMHIKGTEGGICQLKIMRALRQRLPCTSRE